MFSIKTFVKGALALNILALPIYIFSFIVLIPAHPELETSMDMAKRVFDILAFQIGPQILAILGIFVFTKIWDLLLFKQKGLGKMMTTKATFFGIITSTILASIYGNFIVDDFFQLKQGNYLFVLAFGLIPLGYYFLCYILGRLVENIFQKRLSLPPKNER